MKVKQFRVAAVSTNCNSFGLAEFRRVGLRDTGAVAEPARESHHGGMD